MSDYGFKTLKYGKNSQDGVAINAKYPILGFDLSHNPPAYVTIHISDTKDNPIANSSNTPGYSAPSLPETSSLSNLPYYFSDGGSDRRWVKGGSNYTSGYVRTEIYRYKHGYDFRPACYGTITGDINLKIRTNAVGNKTASPYNMPTPAGNYYYRGSLSDNNYNLLSAYETTTDATYGSGGQLFPYMNGMKTIYGGPLNSHRFMYSLLSSQVPTTSSTNDAIKRCVQALTTSYFNKQVTGYYPYEFAVDNEYIRIYRTYYWCEIYGRIYFDETFTDDDLYWRIEMKDYIRTKMVEELAGSEIDINIMMFPYKMEDLS